MTTVVAVHPPETGAQAGSVVRLRVAVDTGSHTSAVHVAVAQLAGVLRYTGREPGGLAGLARAADVPRPGRGAGQLLRTPLLPAECVPFFLPPPCVLAVERRGGGLCADWRVPLPEGLPPSYAGARVSVEYVVAVGVSYTADSARREGVHRGALAVRSARGATTLRHDGAASAGWTAADDVWRAYLQEARLPRSIIKLRETMRDHTHAKYDSDAPDDGIGCTALSAPPSPGASMPSENVCYALCTESARLGDLRIRPAAGAALTPGGALEVRLSLDALAAPPAAAVRLALERTEAVALAAPLRTSTLVAAREISTAMHGDAAACLHVPADAPASFVAHPVLAVAYVLRVSVLLADGAVMDSVFPVTVTPS